MSEDEEPAAAAGSITQDEREENALYGFKRRIEACFNNAGHAWLEAVRVLETAERVLSPRDFSSLREEFKWHYSTVRKFIKIARDPFLQRHEAKLACVDSWSVLHEITKLDEAGRDLFEAEYLSGRAARYITRRQVQECRTVKPQQANRRRSVQRKQTNSGLVLATIEVDSELSESDLEELSAEIWMIEERLSQKFPAVRMVISKSLPYRDARSDPETKKAAKALVKNAAWSEARH